MKTERVKRNIKPSDFSWIPVLQQRAWERERKRERERDRENVTNNIFIYILRIRAEKSPWKHADRRTGCCCYALATVAGLTPAFVFEFTYVNISVRVCMWLHA